MITADEEAWRDFYCLRAIKLSEGRGRVWKASGTLQLKLLTAVRNYFSSVVKEENLAETVKLRVEGRVFNYSMQIPGQSGIIAMHSVVYYCQLSVFRVSELLCYKKNKDKKQALILVTRCNLLFLAGRAWSNKHIIIMWPAQWPWQNH